MRLHPTHISRRLPVTNGMEELVKRSFPVIHRCEERQNEEDKRSPHTVTHLELPTAGITFQPGSKVMQTILGTLASL